MDFEEFADSLTKEALAETANRFFGTRKALDDDIAYVHSYVDKLRELSRVAYRYARSLHYLLLRGKAADAFYRELGVEPFFIPAEELQNRPQILDVPFACTSKGCFTKLVVNVYDLYEKSVFIYNHGRYVDDPKHKGRKILSHNYEFIINKIDALNKTIDEVNTNMPVDSVLRFAKSFDLEGISNENSTGATLPYGNFSDMVYTPVRISDMNLPVFPELPRKRDIKPKIVLFCAMLYSGNKKEILNILAGIRNKQPEKI